MSEKNYNFQKLTPSNKVELNIYDDALEYVFANKDIKNVAISGAYSSGKSSMIETYKNAHSKIKFLHISLAHFQETEQDISTSTVNSEPILEGKILNQLIHQIDPKKIPQTNFKVKQKVSRGMTIKNSLITILFLILAAYIIGFKSWSKFILTLTQPWLKNNLMFTTNSVALLLSGILCTCILGLTIFSIINVQKNKNIFKKVNIQGTEIEIFEENKESYFDKYLNEVLYIFRNSSADVIVFEDMDRYNINKIFEKLREINNLVNNKEDKIIRFFYLIRDDIFTSKDRTKFFDFIVPIVPVIDGSNSYDKFIEHFKEGGIFELFNENFLKDLSLYVDDMRILKNIYNEFVIYHNRIQSIELNNNKLLAIIVYKNIFPRDFSDLQLGMGFVNTLFENKDSFIEKEIQKINNKIQDLNMRIQQAKDELLENIDELDAIFLKTDNLIFYVNRQQESNFETRAKFIRAIKDNPNSVQYNNPSYGLQAFNMTSKFNNLLQDPIYIQRKEAIDIKSTEGIEKLKSDIQKLQKQEAILQNSRLGDIISRENIGTIFSVIFTNEIGKENKFEEIKASPYFDLIKYLIRYGHIDETYPDYMTYFYENSLSRIDKMFLRSVSDQVHKEYLYSLKNPKLVLSRLQVLDFDHEEILNFDLLCYLLKTKQSNGAYLTSFFQQLKETKNLNFIGQFLDTRREIIFFIETLNQFWPSIWKCIINESNFSDAQKKQYVIDTLYFSPNPDIKALNENGCLTAFISNIPTFLDIYEPNIDKIIAGFSLLEVRFDWIDYSTSNKDLFQAVYSNNVYKISFEIISLILEKKYILPQNDDFISKNYTLILSKQEEPLVPYVKDNINHYISIILENCNKHIDDEEFVALEILNNKEVELSNKEEYINYLQTVIEHIENVEDQELWSLLLQQEQVKYSEDNILKYFFHNEKGLDTFLVQFVNANIENLSFDYNLINNKFGDNTASKFYNAIVTCNKLFNNKYENILFTLHRSYNSFIHKGVAGEKIMILNKLGVIQMNIENLAFIRENYPDNLIQYIVKNIDKYAKDIITKDNFNFNEMLLLLEENVTDDYKIQLLQYSTDKISIQQKNYSNAVKVHILKHNLDEGDIMFLLKAFRLENDEVKEIIKNISIEHIAEIIAQQNLIPFELFAELLNTRELNIENKKNLFITNLPKMNKVQGMEYLKILNMVDFLSLFDGKRPKFEVNPVNEQILNIFNEKDWVTRFDIDKEDSNYYRAIGRKSYDDKPQVS